MPAKKKKNGGGFWGGLLLFCFGMTAGLGGAAAVIAYTNELHLPLIDPPTRRPPEKRQQRGDDDAREEVEFHEILRRRQDPPEIKEGKPTPAPAAVEQSSRQFVYYLQISAFRREPLAEQMRGELILGGWKTIINTGQLADGNTLYRVWVGPYDDEEEAESARARLALEGYADVSLLTTTQ